MYDQSQFPETQEPRKRTTITGRSIGIALAMAAVIFGGLYLYFQGEETSTTEVAVEKPVVEETQIVKKKEVRPQPPAEIKMHFAFDSDELNASAKANLNAWATYLKANAAASVRLAGHCDERGTKQYNDVLGQNRADAAKRFLVASGIDPARIRTVSFGEDQPLASGSDESSWSQNRRVMVELLDAQLSQN